MTPEIERTILLIGTVLDIIGKGFGLWHAAKYSQRNWFIAMLVLNTAGILPVIYLKFFQKKP